MVNSGSRFGASFVEIHSSHRFSATSFNMLASSRLLFLSILLFLYLLYTCLSLGVLLLESVFLLLFSCGHATLAEALSIHPTVDL